MTVVHQATAFVVPALFACASSAPRTVADPNDIVRCCMITSDATGDPMALDSARADSLARAGVLLETVVDERPEIVFGPQLTYPEEAREQCITGRVIIQTIVGRDGRVERTSVRVIQHVHPSLDRTALEYLWHASFKPGKVRGVAVRTIVNQPIDFKISGRLC
jgi:TonB family protein